MITKTLDEINLGLLNIGGRLSGLEESVGNKLMILNKRRSITFGQASDYGSKEFVIKLTYDEVNTEQWLEITKEVAELIKQYQTLREQQFELNRQLELKKVEEVATDQVVVDADMMSKLKGFIPNE